MAAWTAGFRRARGIASLALVGALAIAASPAAPHEFAGAEHRCAAHGGGFAADPPADPSGRHYAPDRPFDVLHVAIDATPDFRARTIAGSTSIRLTPTALPIREIALDAHRLRIDSVAVAPPAAIRSYEYDDATLRVRLVEDLAPGVETTVTVVHSAEPRRGIYFRTREMGYPAEDEHLWTQGETHEARHWFPGVDSPIERFTSEVVCRVPPDMTVLSNGRLVSEVVDPASGLKVVRWLQEKSHPGYLIALCAGYFDKIEGRHGSIPLSFHAPPSRIAFAENSFRETADMMAFFEEETGVPYPWAKYSQVVVHDFIWGGMENTTLTILTDRTLFPNETETTRSSRNLVAHELIHQWFGDYVTCKDWSHIWLNESFATYYAHLYAGRAEGRDARDHGLWNDLKNDILAAKDDKEPILKRDYESSMEMFGYRSYEKGGWVLHMLRSRVGDELWKRAIKLYLERNALSAVETADLQAAFEETTGLTLDRFFDQWLRRGGVPKLKVSYSWNEADRAAAVTVVQEHAAADASLLYEIPTMLRFRTEDGWTADRNIVVSRQREDFVVSLPKAPSVVHFDPEFVVMADVKFDKPFALLRAQLGDRTNMIGRLRAVEAMKERDDAETVEALAGALRDDPYWGVRVEAAKALGEIGTPAAWAALSGFAAEAGGATDARVRREVATRLADFYRAEAPAALTKIANAETNPDVRAAAVAGLARYPASAEARESILSALASTSFMNLVADAAIRAIAKADDPAYAEPLRTALAERGGDFTTRGFGEGLKVFAKLLREADDKATAFDFVLPFLDDPRRGVRVAAMEALALLGDPRAVGPLETFAALGDADPEGAPARKAIESLRAGKPPAAEVDDLRKEVLSLKESREKLEDEIESLKKRMDARETEAAPEPADPAAAPAESQPD